MRGEREARLLLPSLRARRRAASDGARPPRAPGTPTLDSAETPLFEALRGFRLERARAEGVPAVCDPPRPFAARHRPAASGQPRRAAPLLRGRPREGGALGRGPARRREGSTRCCCDSTPSGAAWARGPCSATSRSPCTRAIAIGIVGPNGAGKTTLLRIAAGDEPPDGGRVVRRARRARGHAASGDRPASRDRSVREEVSSVLGHLDELEREIAQLEAEMARRGREGSEVLRGARAPLRPRALGVRVRRRLRARGAGRARARRPGLRRGRPRPAPVELQRRLADARRAREAAALRARRAAARRAHQPSRSALDPVVRGDARRSTAAPR